MDFKVLRFAGTSEFSSVCEEICMVQLFQGRRWAALGDVRGAGRDNSVLDLARPPKGGSSPKREEWDPLSVGCQSLLRLQHEVRRGTPGDFEAFIYD